MTRAATIADAPIRIQRRRTRGWKLPENAKCVTRPGKWGNPFRGPGAVEKHWHWLMNDPMGKMIAAQARVELRGRSLACFCSLSKPCHADNLLKVAGA